MRAAASSTSKSSQMIVGDVPPLRAHPFPEALPRVAKAVDAREELRDHRLLERAVPEIGADRLGDGGRVVDQDALELGEVRAALLVARVWMSQVRLALEGEDALRLVLRDVDPPKLCRLGHGSDIRSEPPAEARPTRVTASAGGARGTRPGSAPSGPPARRARAAGTSPSRLHPRARPSAPRCSRSDCTPPRTLRSGRGCRRG